jgi:hypothetical protein
MSVLVPPFFCGSKLENLSASKNWTEIIEVYEILFAKNTSF